MLLNGVLVHFFPKVLGNIIADYAVGGEFLACGESVSGSGVLTCGLVPSYFNARVYIAEVNKDNLVSVAVGQALGDKIDPWSRALLPKKVLKHSSYDTICVACNTTHIMGFDNTREDQYVVKELPILSSTMENLALLSMCAKALPLSPAAISFSTSCAIYLMPPATQETLVLAWENTVNQLTKYQDKIRGGKRVDYLTCIQHFPKEVFKKVMDGEARLGFYMVGAF